MTLLCRRARVTCFVPGLILLLLAFASPALADVKLAAVFGDHMVLQQGRPFSVRGTADPGEKVTVKLAGQTVSAVTGTNGQWQVTIAALKASAKAVEFSVAGQNTITVEDVLVGDVWLCSGQSNMVYPVAKDASAREELPQADHPLIRLSQLSTRAEREPLAERKLNWAVCTPRSAGKFSDVGYFFGRDVQAATGVPIGLICSAVSGTPAQCWTSWDALKSDPAFKPYQDLYERNQTRSGPTNNPEGAVPGTPGSLFNGMIAPLLGLEIKGVVWYQGESNAGDAEIYRKLLPAMITDWRSHWNQAKLPFLIVQLPPFGRRQPEPQPSKWAIVREAQSQTLSLPNTGMAVSIDLGRPRNILHPPNKREIGRRMALVARAEVYHQKVDYAGPVFKSSKVKGNKIVLTFHNVGNGLSVGTSTPGDPNQPVAAPGLALLGFTIAGTNQVFVRAEAVIEGDTVIVSSDKVSAPVAARYGWEENPEVNLYNKKGFPAAPFRTDTWSLAFSSKAADTEAEEK